MINALVTFSGIALFGGIVTLLDWLARRKDREEHKRT